MKDGVLGWFGIVRLGLVQASLGAIVVLTTSVLNRVMVVELALPAMVPGALVALHFALQVLRPRLGHGSDTGGRSSLWIIGGMAALAVGGLAAAVATAWMETDKPAGIGLAVVAFTLIGIGVGASGTTLLVLMAKCVAPSRRAAAATTVWVMMIVGFIVTTAVAGRLLDPYSASRLVLVSGAVSGIAFFLTVLAVWNVEPRGGDADATQPASETDQSSFREALWQVWAEPQARRFAIFVFISMLAYSAQDLILEPYAGTVFSYTPGQTTQLSSLQHGGVLVGMVLVAVLGSAVGGPLLGSMRMWTIGGCITSAAALFGLAVGSLMGPPWPLREVVFGLGVANGAYAVAAIGSMMSLAGSGRKQREGVRMGLWGAAQAIAFGLGGFVGTLASDIARILLGAAGSAYACVFAGEALLFLVSVGLTVRANGPQADETQASQPLPTATSGDVHARETPAYP
jgi:MFS transporter, BCD family, chlorophyll transporter